MTRDQKIAQEKHMRMYYNMQQLQKERQTNIEEKLMPKNELAYMKPRVQHLL